MMASSCFSFVFWVILISLAFASTGIFCANMLLQGQEYYVTVFKCWIHVGILYGRVLCSLFSSL